jgi:hypothetical protein
MKCFLVGAATMIACFQAANAGPATPVEDLLERADVVFVGRVSLASTNQVDLETVELLRGAKERVPSSFRFNSLASGSVDERSLVLVLSSGPKAQPNISLGQPVKGGWDWIMLPVLSRDSSNAVDRAFSVRLGRRLTLEEAKGIVRRDVSKTR